MTKTYVELDPAWTAAVPGHWRWLRNKELLFEAQTLSKDGSEELLSVSHLTGVGPRSEKNVTMTAAETLDGYRVVERGDLVINTMWAWMGALGVTRQAGIVSPAYGVYRPRPRAAFEPRFFDHLYRSTEYVMEMTRLSRGIWSSRLRIYPDVFLRMAVPVPPMDEQRAIADYLDRETARIDTLIQEQQRLIEMLSERRRGVLSRASDGDWPTASLGLLLAGIKDGTHGSFSRTAPGDGMPLLGARNVMRSSVVLDGAESFISSEDYRSIVANGFPATGDVLLVIVGATIGKTAVYNLETRHAFQRSVAFLRPTERLESKFLWYQIQASRFQDELALRAKTSAQPGIYMGDVSAIPVVVPPLGEQRQVVAYLDEQTAKIDALITETVRFVELSGERRSALITAAVTGQVDVREVA